MQRSFIPIGHKIGCVKQAENLKINKKKTREIKSGIFY